MGRLSGSTAVITGATSGIGRQLALSLASHGVHLILIGRDPARTAEVKRLAEDVGDEITVDTVELDLAGDVEPVGRALAEQRSVDILIHSAGTILLRSVADTSAEELDRHWQVNLRSVFLLTRALLPSIVAACGQIVFLNSSAAQQKARPAMAAYTASKYALTAFADSLRDEVNAEGVRVVSVYPGRTATPMQQYLHEAEGKPYRAELLLQPGDVAEAIVAALSMPPTAEITDISVRPFRKS